MQTSVSFNDAGLLLGESGRDFNSATYSLNSRGLRFGAYDSSDSPAIEMSYDSQGNLLSRSEIYKYANVNKTIKRRFADIFTFRNDTLERIDFPGGYFDENGKAHYLLADYLGNVTMQLNTDGYLERNISYYPYGEVHRQPAGQQLTLFGGKERVSHVLGGSYDYGPRYLDSPLCQWAAPDRLASETPWLASHVFCAANPVKYSDPSGDKIYAYETDGNSKYFWECKNDVWGFYNSSNELYNGVDEFILELTKALSFIMGGKTGAWLIMTLVDSPYGCLITNNTENSSWTRPSGNIFWYTNGVPIPTTMGLKTNSYIDLAHEMGHTYLKYTRQEPVGVWFTYDDEKQVLLREIVVTHIENLIRAENDLPLRTHYGRTVYGLPFGPPIINSYTNTSYYFNKWHGTTLLPNYSLQNLNYCYKRRYK